MNEAKAKGNTKTNGTAGNAIMQRGQCNAERAMQWNAMQGGQPGVDQSSLQSIFTI